MGKEEQAWVALPTYFTGTANPTLISLFVVCTGRFHLTSPGRGSSALHNNVMQRYSLHSKPAIALFSVVTIGTPRNIYWFISFYFYQHYLNTYKLQKK